MCIYYVYAYLRKDGTPYYIGKGKNDRAFQDHITHKPPKDKSRIVFLEANLTDIGALALERRMIRWYGRKDLGTGILRNKTDGGEGISGYKHSITDRQKISISCQGRIITEETRKKISAANKGKPSHMKGKSSPMKNISRPDLKGKSRPRKICPHCQQLVDIANYARDHGDKCVVC